MTFTKFEANIDLWSVEKKALRFWLQLNFNFCDKILKINYN